MILEIIITVSSLLVSILGYTTFNLLRKNEKAEDIMISQQQLIDNIEKQIDHSSKRLSQIDSKGTFESDDEIGWFFKEVKNIQNNLSKFKVTP